MARIDHDSFSNLRTALACRAATPPIGARTSQCGTHFVLAPFTSRLRPAGQHLRNKHYAG
jgi:hypothetical protein